MNRKNKWSFLKQNLWIQYLILFLIMYALVFSPFLIYGKVYLWGSDGMSQHYPSLTYSRTWVKSILSGLLHGKLEVPFWTLWLGFGQEVLGNAVNFRLFNFLFIFFPITGMESYLFFRTFASLFLCGIAFLMFARTRITDRRGLLLGCFIYLFSGYSLYFATRHAFFLEMMFDMPLLMLGVNRIFEKGFSRLYIAIVFLAGISYFYFLYMVTLPTVIYAFFLFFEQEPEKQRKWKGFWDVFFRCVWQFLIGVLMAAFSIWPSLLRTIHSSRMGVQTGNSFLHWDADVYLEFLKGITDMEQIGIYGFIALSSISFFTVCYLFCRRKKEERIYFYQVLLYFLVFLVPAAVMAFSGFAGKTQRWCFILIFWIAMSVSYLYPVLIGGEQKAFSFSVIVLLVYFLIYMAIHVYTGAKISGSIVCLFAGAGILFLINFRPDIRKKQSLIFGVLFLVLMAEMTVKSFELYSPLGSSYLSDYANSGRLWEEGANNAYSALEMVQDNSVYRVDVISTPRSRKYNQMNYGLRNRVNGVSSYYSFSDGRIAEYSLDLGNSQQNIPFLMLDLNQRTALNALAGVKYVAALSAGKNRLPFGYKLVGKRDKVMSSGTVTTEYLYRNKYTLPLAYGYDSWISKEEYDELPPYKKEQVMLQAAVLDEDIGLTHAEPVYDHKVLFSNERLRKFIAQIAENSKYIELYDDHISVKKSGYKLRLPLKRKRKGEIYFVLKNARFESQDYEKKDVAALKEENATRYSIMSAYRHNRKLSVPTVATITASSSGHSDNGPLLNNTHQYYFGERDLLLNLGYGTYKDQVTISFAAAGDYYFDEMCLIHQTMKNYADKIHDLKDNAYADVTVGTNAISIDAYAKGEQLLVIAVPYSDGWTASVNGEKAEIYPANGMYMAVKIPNEYSRVDLHFVSPGFLTGSLVSLITVLSLMLVSFWRMWRSGKKQLQD